MEWAVTFDSWGTAVSVAQSRCGPEMPRRAISFRAGLNELDKIR